MSSKIPVSASLVLMLSTLILSISCGGGNREIQNVLIVTIDTQRADHTGCYGYEKPTTPVLDGLADEGILFENAYTAVPLTLPAHCSLMTSLYPASHGVAENAFFELGDEVETLPEILRTEGFQTAAVVGGFVLDSKFGLSRGFDYYEDDIKAEKTSGYELAPRADRTAGEVNKKAVGWLRSNGGKPFFLWVHYFDPHYPYEPPSPFDGSFGNPYDGEIAYADSRLGLLLEELERLDIKDNTLIAVLSDHGEGLGDHGEPQHGYYVYESTLRIPFVIRPPGGEGIEITENVSIVDLAPTVLDFLGLPGVPSFQGRSLLPLWDGSGKFLREYIYFESRLAQLHFGWSGLAGAIDGNLKYIYTPDEELYDLQKDGGETINLAPEHPSTETMRNAVKEFYVPSISISGHRRTEPGEMQEKLKSLGYLAGGVSPAGKEPKDFLSGADPKSSFYLYLDYKRASTLAKTGRTKEAIGMLNRILNESESHNYEVHCTLAAIYEKMGNKDRALEHFRRIAKIRPSPLTYHKMGKILRQKGDYVKSRRVLEEGLKLFPAYAALRNALGVTLILMGKTETGADQFKEAIETDRENIQAYLNLAYLSKQTGDREKAEFYINRAVQIAPGDKRVTDLAKQISRMSGR